MKEKNIINLKSEIDKNIKFYVNRKLSRNINMPLPIKNFPSIDNENNKRHNKKYSSVFSSKDELSTTKRTNNYYLSNKQNNNNNNNNNNINKQKRSIFNNLNFNNNNNNIFEYQTKNSIKISNSIPRNSISVLDRNKIKSIRLQHLTIDINNNNNNNKTHNEKNFFDSNQTIFKLKSSK